MDVLDSFTAVSNVRR